MADTTADVLAAQGLQVQLIDGSTVSLRYSMRSIAALEARFGSLMGIQTEVQAAARALEAAKSGGTPEGGGAIFTVLCDAIAPGLLHERVTHPDTGAVVRLGTDVVLVQELLDPARLSEYLSAFSAAFSQAFGADAEAQAGGATPPAQGATVPPSPGLTGTTSPSSSAADQTTSSGA